MSKTSKRITIFVGLIIAWSASNAYAIPSVKKLGTTPGQTGTVAAVKTNSAVPQRTGSIRAKTATGVISPANVVKNTTDADAARLSLTKYIGNSKIKPGTTPGTVNNNTGTVSPVSSNELANLTNRVQELESQSANAVNSVTESGTGNYVSGISVSGNTLNVTKTNLLHAPIRTRNGDATNDDAEIWIVK